MSEVATPSHGALRSCHSARAVCLQTCNGRGVSTAIATGVADVATTAARRSYLATTAATNASG